MQNLLNPLRALKTKVGYSILTAVVVALFSVWVFLDEAKAEVVIAADGDVQKVKTSSDTVGELLDDVGVDFEQHDELSHEATTEVVDGMEIVVESANKVTVNIDGEEEVYNSTAETVGEFLEEENIEVKKHDVVSYNDMAVLQDDMFIDIDRAFKVTLNNGGDKEDVWATASTVKELLQDEDIAYNKQDKIEPALDKDLKEGMTVTVTKVKTETKEVTETLSFNTDEEKDSELEKGKSRTISEGEEGKVERTYEIVYENGEEVDRTLLEENVVQKPKNKKVAIGTKEEVETVSTSNSQEPSGGKELTMEATAYGADCAGCSGISATGMDLRGSPTPKVIAVDPNVIPLGSRVWVEGYGEAIAADTGGAIKGNIIDVLVESEAYAADNWGRRTVKVKILD
ncbi:ubiquitin-like domain-containing protein [Pseudogracilibacillus sp. ICA-222130]|uniref:ubiquitin-like domain-containing protein n=1 Tax=Pseudogracilibacillus sp. ICA-222130 TaxID=3134655 RepID=UPI0030BF510E